MSFSDIDISISRFTQIPQILVNIRSVLESPPLVRKFRPKAVPDFFKDVSVFSQILLLETVFYACLEHQKILQLEFIWGFPEKNLDRYRNTAEVSCYMTIV